eukprot:CAMPEP_0202713118 /NCGR_PEP_ID=MMETSP1385-20130828/50036_1 /ASSEMBLY_ACC=CAM_ASM_000861 /TAXON_ID=933848 /ORGANISM="Elphidium margaritaceum" /LENGTH=729 /DNA_ID=CAMNT_0049373367 /DNA_START=38 /DNA_END=2227 /DNA_ORIENTATION=-
MVTHRALRWYILLLSLLYNQCCLVHCYLDRVYTASNDRYLTSVIVSSQDSDSALFEKSLLTTFYATEALLLPNEAATTIPNAGQLCDTLRSQSASSWEEFHHLLMTRLRLHGCLDTVKSSSLKKLNDGPSASKLSTVYFAVDAIYHLASHTPAALYDASQLDVVQVLRHVQAFQSSDQLFVEQGKNSKSSVHKTAIALSIAAKLLSMPQQEQAWLQQSEQVHTLLSSFMDAANALVRTYVRIEEDKVCYSNSLTATSTVLESLDAFLAALSQHPQFASMTAAFTKFGDAHYMECLTRYVLSFTSTTSPTSARHVLRLMHMFRSSLQVYSRPFSIALQHQVFSDSEADKGVDEAPLTVRVCDLFGASVLRQKEGTRVEIVSSEPRGPIGAFTALDDGQTFVYAFGDAIRRRRRRRNDSDSDSENGVHGFYAVRIEIGDDHLRGAGGAGAGVIGVSTTVKVTTSLSKTVFGVAYAKKADDGYYRVPYPERIVDTYEVSPTQKLKFEIQTRSLQRPRHISIEFVADASGASVLQMTPKARQQKYALTIDLNKEVFAALRAEGTYSVNVVIGDALYRECVTWTQVVRIACIEEEEDAVDEHDYEPVNDEVPTWTPKAAIAHTFAEADAEATSQSALLFALVFCGVVALPLLYFLYFVFASMGISLVFDRETQLCSLSFILALCAIGGVLFMFWWQWNIFEAGAWLSMVSAPALWFGYTVLKMHLKNRINSKQE